ncbi:uncharacterized protein LOC111265068 [Varroa jacobsoni]|uniref:uncharacterized protein LOC111265068 n=1 Tax=Varroa jacobsoni TaxID=62625 RepID=UPI000BF90C3C|nr:uncharacterized protein LOC111265068 [Varroa jacobsoni]XP_022697158.1 uncharacterized protein LOC111265068 [Varroa jacobsoni]XP_022697159.1 uncharacterized protein LOC111265068 [Varroa jacobsoni]XP_022697160.1 uncharacterized protein LOC111265068 [Varroa jacobsoni]
MANQDIFTVNAAIFLRTLLIFGFAIHTMTTVMLVSAADGPTTASTAATQAVSSESTMTTSTESSVKSTTMQCTKAYEYDCCQDFTNVSISEAEEIVRRAIDYQNIKENKTSWTLDSVETAKMKDCKPPYYKVKARLNKTTMADGTMTVVDCQMRFLYRMADTDESDTGGAMSDTIIVKDFCNGATVWQRGVTFTFVLPVLTFFNRKLH